MSGGLSERQWDELLDGSARLVDMSTLKYNGGIPSFRAAVYREAEKRFGYAKTKRTAGSMIQVQGYECLPAAALRGPSLSSAPTPPGPIPGPRPTSTPGEPAVEADLEGWSEEELLGPCTCGQSPTCLPTCARVGG